MADPTYPWNNISSTQTDADSPINETLMEGIRQNLIHLMEWLGVSYTPAQDHDHDGVNSKEVTSVADGAITHSKLDFSIVANTSQVLNPASTWTVPAGRWNLVFETSDLQLEVFFGPPVNNWKTSFTAGGGCISDGTNVRVKNNHTTLQRSVYYQKY